MMTINENRDVNQALFHSNGTARHFLNLLAAFLFLAGMPHCAGPHGALSERLHSSDDRTKQSAVKELNALDSPSKKKHLGSLKKMLYDNNRDNQILAAESLGHMGPAAEEAVPDLVQILNEDNIVLRVSALKALGEIGTGAVPSLITILHHQDPVLRNSAVDALGSIGPGAKEAVPELALMLSEREHDTARHAASALGLIGPAAVPALIQVPGRGDPYATDRAVTAFANFKADPAVIHELAQFVANANADPGVRGFAAKALGTMREKAEEAIPDLARALGEENTDVRTAARWALGQIGPKAIPALREALKNSNPRVRFSAAFALGSLGPAAAEAVPSLLQAMKDEDRTVRINAILALGKTGVIAQVVVQALAQVLEADGDEVVCLDALRVLNTMGTPEAKEAVIRHNKKNKL